MTETDTTQVERTLPGEQQPDGELNDAQLRVKEADELSQHFEDIHVRTMDENLVKGFVHSINTSKKNAAISVEVDVPAEDDFRQFFFDKPKVWTSRYDFVRWLDKYGYSSGDFAGMIENDVEVEVQEIDDGYGLVIPPRDKTFVEKQKERVSDGESAVKASWALLTIGVFIAIVSAIFGMWSVVAGGALFGLLFWVGFPVTGMLLIMAGEVNPNV